LNREDAKNAKKQEWALRAVQGRIADFRPIRRISVHTKDDPSRNAEAAEKTQRGTEVHP